MCIMGGSQKEWIITKRKRVMEEGKKKDGCKEIRKKWKKKGTESENQREKKKIIDEKWKDIIADKEDRK